VTGNTARSVKNRIAFCCNSVDMLVLGKISKFLESHERVDLVFFVLIGLVMVVWFRQGYFVYVWDTTYPVNAAAYLGNFSNVWRSINSTGFSDANGLPFLPYFAVVYFLQNVVALPLPVAETVLYYSLFVMSGMSMYIFAHRFLQGLLDAKELRIISLVSGLFYTINLYTLYYIWRIFTVEAFLVAFFPLVAFEVWKGLEKARTLGRIDVLGVVRIELLSLLILPAFTNPAFLLTGAGFLTLLVAYGLWQDPRHRRPLLRQAGFSTLALSFWALSNLWWILPQLANSGVVLARLGPDWLDLQSNSIHSTLQNVLRLQGMPPLYQQAHGVIVYPFSSLYQSAPLFVAISVLIPIVSFASLTKSSPAGRRAIFIAIVSAVFLFAAEGLNPPFGPIFGWLYGHVSFMVAFRDPYQKIGWIIPVTYSILFSLGTLRIYRLVKVYRIGNHVKITRLVRLLVPTTLVVLVIGVYCWPFFTGDIVLPGATVAIPSYYYSANSYLDSKSGTFRILSLPLDQVLQGSVWDHGYVGNDLLRATTGNEVISTFTPDQNVTDLLNNAMTLLQQNNTHVTNILGVLNVKYVVIRHDANLNYSLAPTSPSILESEIANQVGLSHSATFGMLDFYENGEFGPRIYAVTNITSSGSLTSPTNVGWTLKGYDGPWLANDPSASLTSSSGGLSFSFTPNSTHPYAYFSNVDTLNVSIGAYPYMLLTFRTSDHAMLSVNVVSQSGASFFLSASNPPAVSSGTAYSSPQSYTLLFPLARYFKPSDALAKIFVNLTPTSPGQSQMLETTLSGLQLAGSVGTNLDTVRLIASSSFNWTSTAIAQTSSQIDVSRSPPRIVFQELGPSEYRVNVANATSPFLLIFESTFDYNWQLFPGTSHVGVPVVADHVRVDGYANGWIINIPGTYILTIFYGIQNYAEFGFYVSIAAILSLVSFALVTGLNAEARSPWLRRLTSIIRHQKTPNNKRISHSTSLG